MIASDYPITLLSASILTLMFIVLSFNVSRQRIKKLKTSKYDDAVLERTIRTQANFVEYVPIFLIMLFLLENSDINRVLLIALSTLMIGARILHALGLSQSSGRSFGRYWGTVLTWLMLIIMGVTGMKIILSF